MDQIPITTHRARVAIWVSLILSIIDFAFSLSQFGSLSLFVGLAATVMSIVHLSTFLILINIREKRARKAGTGRMNKRATVTNTDVFPPTSNLGGLIFTGWLVCCYIAAFVLSTWNLSGYRLSIISILVGFDAAFELLCAGALMWMMYVGIKERKVYLEISKNIRLDDINYIENSGVQRGASPRMSVTSYETTKSNLTTDMAI